MAWTHLQEEEETDKLFFVFDGGSLSSDQIAAIRINVRELSEFAFFSIDAINETILTPKMVDLLTNTLQARTERKTLYVELTGIN
ncbi:MAG: hypothetical protein ACREN8_03995 [Candidatus Dormibacteraceae bacterium]